ncbi:WD40 repeat domain-containing serine/threonine protein kinase [Sphaerisporangium melleum]|nr:WD40 repeat domain-containing serine/threonine protein kinase [Sphaerisporangium melleum]
MVAAALTAGDPARLGDYWLAGRLGAGGQGVVYEAYDAEGARVAVKVLHADAAGDPDLRSRFGKEAVAARRVASFCTARVLAVDLEAAKPYIVSEYIPGPSLRRAVSGGRRFAGDDLYRLATAVATALTAIHDAGVVHRDLKPDNVLLGPDGPRVIDFGIARTLEMSLTATGLVTGTPTYMAPEVFTGERAGAPADVFSWGAIVVYAANGDDPFRAESLGAVMHRVLATDPDLRNLPDRLRPLVAAALSKDPQARPSARELLLGLLTGFHGSQAELLTLASAEAGMLGRDTITDPALGTLAEEAYGFLDAAERGLVPDVFLRLVGVGDAGQITMRSLSRGELLDGRTPQEAAALDRVLDVFSYLLTTRGDEVRLSRPALIQAWPRLRSWVGDERDGLPVHETINSAARHWNDHGRREADVFQGSRLAAALSWAATGRRHLTLSGLERDFLAACDAAVRDRVRRRRLLTAALATLLVLALTGGAIAVQQARTVTAQREMLAARLAEAMAGKVAAEADTIRTTDPVRAMLLSVAAWRLADLPGTRATLHNAWAQRERAAFTDPDTAGDTVRRITLDGRRLFSVSPRGVRVYDPRTGRRVDGWDDVKIGGQAFRDAALSPDGRRLAIVAGGTVQVWDTVRRRPTARYELVAQQNFNDISFGLSDRWLTVREGQGAVLWDMRTGATLDGEKVSAPIVDTAFTPAGDLAAVSLISDPERFALLRLPSGEPVARWHDADGCAGTTATAVAFSPDGRTLACGTHSAITLVDVRTGRSLPHQPYLGWDWPNGRMRFSPDGRLLLAGGEKNVRLIRVADARTLLTYNGTVEGAGFDGPTLRFLAGGTVVDVDVAGLLTPARLPGAAPQAALYSPDGRLLITQAENARSLVLRDPAGRPAGRPIRLTGAYDVTLPAEPAFSADGRTFAFAGDGNGETVRLWDTERQAQIAQVPVPQDWYPHSLAMSPDGALLAIGARTPTGDDEQARGRLMIWDVRHGRWGRSIDLDDNAGVVFRPGTTTVAQTRGPSNRLLDVATGRQTGPSLGPARDSQVVLAFSPDGTTLAFASSGGLSFWDVRTGARRGPVLKGMSPRDLVFSPRGDVLAAVGEEVQFVDVATIRKLGVPLPAEDASWFVSAGFGSGGAVLHTIEDSGVLHEIPVDPARMAAAVCARAGRTLTPAEWHASFPGVEPYRDPCH